MIKTYPISIMMQLNRGDTDPDILRVASMYKKITDMYADVKYNNHFNNNFSSSSRDETSTHGVIHRADVFSEERVVEDVRKLVNQINNTNVSSSISKFNGAKLDELSTKRIAQLFHNAMINSSFLLAPYVDVYTNIKNKDHHNDNLNRELVTLVLSGFKNPPHFEDTTRETGEQISSRFRQSTAIIISYLYSINLPQRVFQVNFTSDKICSHFLKPLFERIELLDEEAVEIVSQVWRNIKTRLGEENPENLMKYTELLKGFSQNKSIKTTSRIKLIGL